MNLTIDDIYGYHIIDTPEKQKQFEPKQKDDAGYSETLGKWVSGLVNGAGRRFIKGVIYRRPIDVGEGFELVGLDESTDGCEVLEENGEWWPTKPSEFPNARTAIELWMSRGDKGPFAIRRKKQAPADKQITDTERLEWLITKATTDFFKRLSNYPNEARQAIDAVMKEGK